MRTKLSFGQIKFFAHRDLDSVDTAAYTFRVPDIRFRKDDTSYRQELGYMPVWSTIPYGRLNGPALRAIHQHRQRISRFQTRRRRNGPSVEE